MPAELTITDRAILSVIRPEPASVSIEEICIELWQSNASSFRKAVQTAVAGPLRDRFGVAAAPKSKEGEHRRYTIPADRMAGVRSYLRLHMDWYEAFNRFDPVG